MTLLLIIALVVAMAFAVAGAVSSRRGRAAREAAEARAREAGERAGRAEAAAAELFRHLPLAAAQVDADGRLLRLTEPLSRDFPDVTPGETVLAAFGSHELWRAVATALEGGRATTVEVRLLGAERRTHRVVAEPRGGPDGPEVTLLLSDVSEALAYQELRSQFVANVSHELRTPLTGLRGLLEALEDEGMDTGERAALIDRAAQETRRLEAIIVDVLLLSELEAGQLAPDERGCDLVEAVVEAVEEVADLAQARGVELALDLPEAAPVPVSSELARTLARNLAQNAARYAGAGSTARVAVRRGPAEVTLTVADDGVGIAERHLPHVFERFYRADPSRSRELGGTGLGLSIVKHIAERFGGRAEAHSIEGYGTEVRVTLPAGAASEDRPDRDRRLAAETR